MIPICARKTYIPPSSHLSPNECARALRVSRMNKPNTEVARIKESLRRTEVLQELEICHQPLTKHQASLLSQGLYENASLSALHLHHNELNHEQLGILCAALKQRVAKLKKLQLEHNQIGVAAAQQLANYLSTAHVLEHLSLSYNPLGDESVEILAKELGKLTCLKRLDLIKCRIGSGGAYILLEGLRALPSIPVTVNLQKNYLGKSAQECLKVWAKEKGCRVMLSDNRPVD